MSVVLAVIVLCDAAADPPLYKASPCRAVLETPSTRQNSRRERGSHFTSSRVNDWSRTIAGSFTLFPSFKNHVYLPVQSALHTLVCQRQVGRMLLKGFVNVVLFSAKPPESCSAVSNNVETGGWERVVQTGFLKMDSSYVAARWLSTHPPS